jgi:ribosomal protein S21
MYSRVGNRTEMNTIANRVEAIKKQLDELESHVNSTISILDCKAVPINKYPSPYDSYNKFEWRKYNYEWRPLYKSEEQTIEAIDAFKTKFESIHESNKEPMEQNTKTFNKLCDFFEKLGLSKTSYAYSGTGRNRHSHQVESGWVSSLRSQYVMRDSDYESFTNWYKKEKEEIRKFFQEIRTREFKEQMEENERKAKQEAVQRHEEERAKSINLAVEFLISQGKKVGIDFTNDDAIDKAFQVKMEMAKQPPAPVPEVEKPETTNAMQFMDVEE